MPALDGTMKNDLIDGNFDMPAPTFGGRKFASRDIVDKQGKRFKQFYWADADGKFIRLMTKKEVIDYAKRIKRLFQECMKQDGNRSAGPGC